MVEIGLLRSFLVGVVVLYSMILQGDVLNLGNGLAKSVGQSLLAARGNEEVVVSSAGEGTISYEIKESITSSTCNDSSCSSPCQPLGGFCPVEEEQRWLFQIAVGYWGGVEWGAIFGERAISRPVASVLSKNSPLKAVFYGLEQFYPKVSKGGAFFLTGARSTPSGAGLGFLGGCYSAKTTEKKSVEAGKAQSGDKSKWVLGSPVILVPELVSFWGSEITSTTELLGALDISVWLGQMYFARNVYCYEDCFLLLGHFGIMFLSLKSDLQSTVSGEGGTFDYLAKAASWGWGPSVGFSSSIAFWGGASLFGDFDISLLSSTLAEDSRFSKGEEHYPYSVQIPSISPLMHVAAGLKLDCTSVCALLLNFQLFWEQWVGLHVIARSSPGRLDVDTSSGSQGPRYLQPATISARDMMFGGPSIRMTLCF